MKNLLLGQVIVLPFASAIIAGCGTMPLPPLTLNEQNGSKQQLNLVVELPLPHISPLIAIESTQTLQSEDIEPAEKTETIPPSYEISATALWNRTMELLQYGDEDEARQTLSVLLQNYPKYHLANEMMNILNSEEQSLGESFIDYRLEKGDSLSSLAKKHLGNALKFVLLARYNNIDKPNSIRVGQWIRLPAPARTHHLSIDENYSEGLEAMKRKRFGEAFELFSKVLDDEPEHRSARMQIQILHTDIADSLYRNAIEAQHTQNLDLAISQWDEFLVIRPENALAKFYREKAIRLKSNLAKLIH